MQRWCMPNNTTRDSFHNQPSNWQSGSICCAIHSNSNNVWCSRPRTVWFGNTCSESRSLSAFLFSVSIAGSNILMFQILQIVLRSIVTTDKLINDDLMYSEKGNRKTIIMVKTFGMTESYSRSRNVQSTYPAAASRVHREECTTAQPCRYTPRTITHWRVARVICTEEFFFTSSLWMSQTCTNKPPTIWPFRLFDTRCSSEVIDKDSDRPIQHCPTTELLGIEVKCQFRLSKLFQRFFFSSSQSGDTFNHQVFQISSTVLTTVN